MAGLFSKIKSFLIGDKNESVSRQQSRLLAVDPFAIGSTANKKANTVVASCRNVYSRVVSKLYPQIIYDKKEILELPNIRYKLKYAPNQIQNGVNFWKQVAVSYFEENIAIIYIEKDIREVSLDKSIKAFWLIDPTDSRFKMSMLDDDSKRMFFTFFLGAREINCYSDDLIVLAREPSVENPFITYCDPLAKIVSTIDANFKGLEKTIKNANVIRFLATSPTLLSDVTRKQRQTEMNDLISSVEANGALYVDGAASVVPINQTTGWTSTSALEPFIKQIYGYYGVSQAIVDGTASDDEYNNWVETSIEPFTNELACELTLKLLPRKSIATGRKIVVDTSRLFTASQAHRISIGQQIISSGRYYPNEIRSLLGADLLPEEDNTIIDRIDRIDSTKGESQEEPKPQEDGEENGGEENDS